MKLEVLCFNAQDPLGWIFKITQFFDYQGVSDAERLTVASFYMEGLPFAGFNGCRGMVSSHLGKQCYRP